MKKQGLSDAEIERNREFAEAMANEANRGMNPTWIAAKGADTLRRTKMELESRSLRQMKSLRSKVWQTDYGH